MQQLTSLASGLLPEVLVNLIQAFTLSENKGTPYCKQYKYCNDDYTRIPFYAPITALDLSPLFPLGTWYLRRPYAPSARHTIFPSFLHLFYPNMPKLPFCLV